MVRLCWSVTTSVRMEEGVWGNNGDDYMGLALCGFGLV